MSLDDIRINFTTVVENFITAHSPKGYWPLKQKTTGKVLKLKLEKVQEKSVRQVVKERYSGQVVLRQIDAGKTHVAEFVVDLSGESWRVEKVRLLAPKPAQAPKKPAAAAKPSSDQE